MTEAAAVATARFVDAGYSTVYDGVMGPWLIDRFIATGGFHRVDYAILLPPVETCLSRVAKRSGHGFADETATRKMHHEFSEATIARRHVLPNEHEDPSSTAEQILTLAAAGDLRYIGPV